MNAIYQARTKRRWAVILSLVQSKGLMLFFLTILLLLNCWFLSVVADIFQEYQFKPENARINPAMGRGRLRTGYYEIAPRSEYASFPAIQMLKKSIILLLLLIIPIYKPVDPETLNLDKPFLDLSMGDLSRGGGGDEQRGDDITIRPVDTTRLPPLISVIHDTVKRDTIVLKNYTLHVDTSKRVVVNIPKTIIDELRSNDTMLNRIYRLSVGIDTTTLHNSRTKRRTRG
jgi:hypothetical protein